MALVARQIGIGVWLLFMEKPDCAVTNDTQTVNKPSLNLVCCFQPTPVPFFCSDQSNCCINSLVKNLCFIHAVSGWIFCGVLLRFFLNLEVFRERS